jgi:pumilio homology domain family member 6
MLIYKFADKTKAIQTLLTPVSAEYPSSDLSAPHPLDLPHMGRMYKTLLQGGHFSRENQNIESSKHWEPAKFADAWVSTVGKDVTLAAARAGGTFVVAELVERLLRDGSAETKKMVKEWFKPIRKEIKAWDAKGGQVLAEKVDALFA